MVGCCNMAGYSTQPWLWLGTKPPSRSMARCYYPAMAVARMSSAVARMCRVMARQGNNIQPWSPFSFFFSFLKILLKKWNEGHNCIFILFLLSIWRKILTEVLIYKYSRFHQTGSCGLDAKRLESTTESWYNLPKI